MQLTFYLSLVEKVAARVYHSAGPIVMSNSGVRDELYEFDMCVNLNSLLVKRQIDNTSPGAVTGVN